MISMSKQETSSPQRLAQTSLKKFQQVLERINTKLTLKLPLTAEEVQVGLEAERLCKLKTKIKYVVEGDSLTIVRTNDAEPVFNHVKFLSDLQKDAPSQRSRNQKYVGSLDPITAASISSKEGLRIGSKEFAEYATKKIRTDMTKFKAD